MRELDVRSAHGPYRVAVGTGILDRLAAAWPSGTGGVLVASDTTVAPLHAERLAARLGAGAAVALPAGEEHKRWPAVERIVREALRRGVDRGGAFVAVGGGVVTDTVGFAASIYLRGVRWVAVPTTALAMVDASVGGKTGVNLEEGKNLVGTFWPPERVWIDLRTLETLPHRELRAGLVEAVKAGWIGDHGLLDHLPDPSAPPDPAALEPVVVRALAVKIRIVEADEREAGARQVLNLGHTLGHALEAATGYRRFLHGEAVAWGIAAAGRIAARRGLLGAAALGRLEAALAALGPYPPVEDLGIDRLWPFVERDKKRSAGGVAWVLPTDRGAVTGVAVGRDEAARAWDAVRRECGRMVGR